MNFIVGLVIVFGTTIAGYVLSKGNLAVLVQPYEVLIICGAAFGGFVIANPGKVIKKSFGGIPKLLKGSKYNKALYMDLLSVLFDLFTKARKEGLMALEGDVEEPEQSEIFKKYPKIASDHHVMDFICDYLRLMVGGNMNPFEIENLMDVELETHHQEAELAPSAITNVGDGLPAFGIVAAVMGIIIVMGFVSEPPDVLGNKIAAALVGTFLGIFLSYGIVSPMGKSLEHQAREEGQFFQCIKVCLMATLNGYTPQIAVEFGRKALYSTERPSFIELEEHIKNSGK